MPLGDLLTATAASTRGLAPDEAARRLARDGPNTIEYGHPHRGLRLLLAQFTSPIMLILVAATVLSMGLGDAADGLIIAASGALGFVQEQPAGQAVDALMARVRVEVEVRRGALLVAAGLGQPAEHALISLLALNGLRVSEATGANIEALGVERGHRTLVITRKGGKVATIPLAPRTARAIDLAVGERVEGPIFLTPGGQRLDRHGAARVVRRVTRRACITKQVGPHTLRHAFITAALDAGVPLRDVQEAASHADPRTTMRYDRARGSLDRHATYVVAAYLAGAAR